MNLEDFNKEFGTEEQCRNYLYSIRWGNGYVCPKCKGNKYYKIGDYKYKCANNKCYYQATLTTETIMEKTHIPIQKWFYAVFMYLHDPSLNATFLSKKLNISYKTAYYVFKKLKNFCRYTTECTIYPRLLTGSGEIIIQTFMLKEGNEIELIIGIQEEQGVIEKINFDKDITESEFRKKHIKGKANYKLTNLSESKNERMIRMIFNTRFFWRSVDDDWNSAFKLYNEDVLTNTKPKSLEEMIREIINTPPEPRCK